MRLTQAPLLLALPNPISTHPPTKHCTSSQPCWPPPAAWHALNATLNGRLLTPHPSASPCHDPFFSAPGCAAARANWTSSAWRTAQPGAYAALLWELGDDACGVNATRAAPCGQGRVPERAVDARSAEDVRAAVRFAAERGLLVVVKNTGHDHLGRSSGDGAFGIWTHNMKGREWHTSFVPEGAPEGTVGVPAATLQAGEQWLDVYTDAAAHNVTIVGGSARTVGAVGGYLSGGGHSPFSHFYGLAADNLLEAQLVTPTGALVTLNAHRHAAHFWALRGGGGSAWGVVTAATYATHPAPRHVRAAFVQFNVTDGARATHARLLARVLPLLPAAADGGYVGYAMAEGGEGGGGFQMIATRLNGTEEGFEEAFGGFRELAGGNETGISGVVGSVVFPTWMDYAAMFLRDPNIATNVIDASRLLTKEVLTEKAEELAEVVMDFPDLGPGFNFIGAVNPAERANTAVHPIWAESKALFSFSGDWADDAPAAEKKAVKERLVDVSKRLGAIVGPNGGTYVNEATHMSRIGRMRSGEQITRNC